MSHFFLGTDLVTEEARQPGSQISTHTQPSVQSPLTVILSKEDWVNEEPK